MASPQPQKVLGYKSLPLPYRPRSCSIPQNDLISQLPGGSNSAELKANSKYKVLNLFPKPQDDLCFLLNVSDFSLFPPTTLPKENRRTGIMFETFQDPNLHYRVTFHVTPKARTELRYLPRRGVWHWLQS